MACDVVPFFFFRWSYNLVFLPLASGFILLLYRLHLGERVSVLKMIRLLCRPIFSNTTEYALFIVVENNLDFQNGLKPCPERTSVNHHEMGEDVGPVVSGSLTNADGKQKDLALCHGACVRVPGEILTRAPPLRSSLCGVAICSVAGSSTRQASFITFSFLSAVSSLLHFFFCVYFAPHFFLPFFFLHFSPFVTIEHY